MTTTTRTSAVIETLARGYRLLLLVLSLPVILGEYFHRETGAEYGVGFVEKCVLAAKMLRNNLSISTGSTFVEHLVIATKILRTPRRVEGSVVECGCYKGGSTANLSLVASLCDRELDVFDSFEGMPEPSERDAEHVLVASEEVHSYAAGSWQAGLDEVRGNVHRFGDLSVCRFHEGYFDETMPEFDRPVAAVFLDVGLRDSAETAVEHLWPLLGRGSYLFTHDVKHMEIATLFFDADWWRAHLDREPPGLVGAGNGLGLHPQHNGFASLLGYIVKDPDSLAYEVVEETGAGRNAPNVSLAADD